MQHKRKPFGGRGRGKKEKEKNFLEPLPGDMFRDSVAVGSPLFLSLCFLNPSILRNAGHCGSLDGVKHE